IPRTTQRHGLGQAVNPHHFKLADNSQTVMRHRRTNSWNHGIEPFEFIAHVPDGRAGRGDVHVALEDIDNMHLVAALHSGFYQTTGRVEAAITGQYGNFHKMTEE